MQGLFLPLGGSDQLVQEPGSFFFARDGLIFRPLLDGVPQGRERQEGAKFLLTNFQKSLFKRQPYFRCRKSAPDHFALIIDHLTLRLGN